MTAEIAIMKRSDRNCSELLDRHKEELRNYRRINYVNPVIHVVSALPKNELAAKC